MKFHDPPQMRVWLKKLSLGTKYQQFSNHVKHAPYVFLTVDNECGTNYFALQEPVISAQNIFKVLCLRIVIVFPNFNFNLVER